MTPIVEFMSNVICSQCWMGRFPVDTLRIPAYIHVHHNHHLTTNAVALP